MYLNITATVERNRKRLREHRRNRGCTSDDTRKGNKLRKRLREPSWKLYRMQHKCSRSRKMYCHLKRKRNRNDTRTNSEIANEFETCVENVSGMIANTEITSTGHAQKRKLYKR